LNEWLPAVVVKATIVVTEASAFLFVSLSLQEHFFYQIQC